MQAPSQVVHDWGGLIGLRLLAKYPERFQRVLVANSGLPTGDQKANVSALVYSDVLQPLNLTPCLCNTTGCLPQMASILTKGGPLPNTYAHSRRHRDRPA